MAERLDLDAIEARANAATPGPWAWANTCEKGWGANVGAGAFAEDDDDCATPLSGNLSQREDDYYVDEPLAELGHQNAGPDAEFITAAREDVPALCAALRASRAEVERLRDLAHRAHDYGWTEALYQSHLGAADPDWKTQGDSWNSFVASVAQPGEVER